MADNGITPQETVAQALAGADTLEYQTLISCTTKLRAAVCADLVCLSGCLLERGLILPGNASELTNRNVEEADRAARLVELIQHKVNLDSQNYVKFIDILEENRHHYSDILDILKKVYHSLHVKYTVHGPGIYYAL